MLSEWKEKLRCDIRNKLRQSQTETAGHLATKAKPRRESLAEEAYRRRREATEAGKAEKRGGER